MSPDDLFLVENEVHTMLNCMNDFEYLDSAIKDLITLAAKGILTVAHKCRIEGYSKDNLHDMRNYSSGLATALELFAMPKLLVESIKTVYATSLRIIEENHE